MTPDAKCSHDVVPGLHGFDDLRSGQSVQFTLDDSFLRAASLNAVVDMGQPMSAAT